MRDVAPEAVHPRFVCPSCHAQAVIDGQADTHPLPEPADSEVALLLQTVWDLLSDGEHWPSYRTADRLLYQERRVDIEAVIARTPDTWLLGGRPAGGAQPASEVQLSLTVAGAAACTGTDHALEVFLAAARRAAEVELRALPAGQDLTVTFDAAAAATELSLTEGEWSNVARQSGLLLHAEPWTGHVLLFEGGWEATVDRRVRPYAGVTDLARYWQLREHQRRDSATLEQEAGSATSNTERVVQLQHRRWRIGAQLGSGGFGQVFSATDDAGFAAAASSYRSSPARNASCCSPISTASATSSPSLTPVRSTTRGCWSCRARSSRCRTNCSRLTAPSRSTRDLPCCATWPRL